MQQLRELSLCQRTVAVMGDMLELGPYGEKYHRELGAKMAEMLFDFVIAAGPLSKFTVEEALKQGFPAKKIHQVKDNEEAGQLCREMASAGDWVLVKGSRSTRMEKVFECFTTSSTR
jgi:UDP-N-acetylmuramoyl-tripeptide--D-alanyl-D-alanine ligase